MPMWKATTPSCSRCSSGGQPVDIRKRNFTGSARESDLLIVPLVSQGQHNLERGKGQYFYHVSEGVKERRLHGSAGNSRKDPGTSEGRPSRRRGIDSIFSMTRFIGWTS